MKTRGFSHCLTPAVLTSATLGSAGLEISVPLGGMLPPENMTMVPLKRQPSLPSPPASEPTGKEGTSCLCWEH